MGLYWKDEPGNWYVTKKELCTGKWGDDDSGLYTSSIPLDINEGVGGLSENMWYNWVNHRGPVFLSEDGYLVSSWSGRYLQNKHVFASDDHNIWSNGRISTVRTDNFQELVFHPGATSTYPLSSQPLSTWPNTGYSYYRGFLASGSHDNTIELALRFTLANQSNQTQYRYYPMQWDPVIGLHADAFGGTHHSYKGVIICPVVTQAKLQHRSTSSSRITLQNNTTFDDLFKGDLMLNGDNIDNEANATYNGINTNISGCNYSVLSTIYRSFSEAINTKTNDDNHFWYFQTNPVTVAKTNSYTARANTYYDNMDVSYNNDSLYSITTKYLYSPFKINSHYNWFYGSIMVQLADLLDCRTAADGGCWEAGQGNDFRFVLNHPHMSTDIGDSTISPLSGYIEDLSCLYSAYYSNSKYYIPPGSIWLSWHKYGDGTVLNYDNSINQYNYCSGDGDYSGRFSILLNNLFNGPTDVLYQFFVNAGSSQLDQNGQSIIYSNLNSMLGTNISGLQTKISDQSDNSSRLTVCTISAYVPASLLNSKLGITSNLDYYWFNYSSQSNYMRLSAFPLSDTAGIMIDLFYVVFFDDLLNSGDFIDAPAGIRGAPLDLNAYNGVYGKAYSGTTSINSDYSYLKLFTSRSSTAYDFLPNEFSPLWTWEHYAVDEMF